MYAVNTHFLDRIVEAAVAKTFGITFLGIDYMRAHLFEWDEQTTRLMCETAAAWLLYQYKTHLNPTTPLGSLQELSIVPQLRIEPSDPDIFKDGDTKFWAVVAEAVLCMSDTERSPTSVMRAKATAGREQPPYGAQGGQVPSGTGVAKYRADCR
jgi:hypothetical protein